MYYSKKYEQSLNASDYVRGTQTKAIMFPLQVQKVDEAAAAAAATALPVGIFGSLVIGASALARAAVKASTN